MKAAQASGYGAPNDVLTVTDGAKKPALAALKEGGKGKLLLRTLACSLSPSDYRMLSGDARLIKKPRGGFPYIPGGDVCGEVLEAGPDVTKFSDGDTVVATWSVFGQGGLAEFCVVDAALAVRKPKRLTAAEGAAMANSAGHAVQALREAVVVTGNRVLILGGGGGVGTALVQLAKRAGAAYVATTSTNGELLRSLGADRVINHTKEDWAAVPEFAAEPFDVIIDCAEGRRAWLAATHKKAGSGARLLAPNGRFLAVVLNDWHMKVTNPAHMATLLAPPFARQMGNTLWPFGPRYKMFLGGVDGKRLQEVADLVAAGDLKIVVDPKGPFELTEAGVRAAFELHESRRGQGKVVITVAEC